MGKSSAAPAYIVKEDECAQKNGPEEAVAVDEHTVEGRQHHRLKPNAIGLPGVLFLSVASAAPTTAMVGTVPIAVGFGNGAGAPAGFMVATIILGLFAAGYAAMAKHITATGACYGFVSQGLGRVPGLIAGLLTTLAYVVFEAALVGIFGYFASSLVQSLFKVDINWIIFGALMLVLNALLTYFDISLATKVLGFGHVPLSGGVSRHRAGQWF